MCIFYCISCTTLFLTSSIFSISEKLRIITPLKDQEVNEGQEIIFNCEVNKEGAKEKWYKNGEAIFDSAKYIIVQKDLVYTLRIRDTQLKDQATYSISLSNHRGEHAESSAALTVLGKKLSQY